MLRKLGAVLVAALVTAGLTVAVSTPAHANVVPHHGSYRGVDHGSRTVSFTFNGTQISHFSIQSGHTVLVIGTAHVSNGMWHETCGGGYCFEGRWTTDGHVSGFWRHGGSHTKVAWSAGFEPPVTIAPYAGPYRGRDHSGLGVHLTYRAGHITGFTWDSNHFTGTVAVRNGAFEHCYPTFCIKGHWQDSSYAVGQWRYPSSAHWTSSWEARAYAA